MARIPVSTGSAKSAELREKLKEIDQSGNVEVSTWEAEFLESVLFKNSTADLTRKQMDSAEQIIERYYEKI